MAPQETSPASMDQKLLVRIIMEGFRRTMVHYGAWFAEVNHQLGLEQALEIEKKVWPLTCANQIDRLGKLLGFATEQGVPTALQQLPKETLIELVEKLSINWLANDGIWFQAVEQHGGMEDAKRCNDTCWTRFSPFEANSIKTLLDLPAQGGLIALEQALSFRMYAFINQQSIEWISEKSFIFYMNNCRVQAARMRRNLPDYPCKSAGLVEYRTFAHTIDSRIQTQCIGCPPDPHPEKWFCAWKFSLDEEQITSNA